VKPYILNVKLRLSSGGHSTVSRIHLSACNDRIRRRDQNHCPIVTELRFFDLLMADRTILEQAQSVNGGVSSQCVSQRPAVP
jgi:hypothetical protein